MMTDRPLIVIKGAGDLATGVAYRLFNSGFPIIMTEIAEPLVVRRTVSFAEAIFSGSVTVEGVTAARAGSEKEALDMIEKGVIPVLVDPGALVIKKLQPTVVVDAIMAKGNKLTRIDDAPLVIGIGPGFNAGVDVHAIIETKRGHNLGRVIYAGSAIPDTGAPGEVLGYSRERLLRAPVDGIVKPCYEIGQQVKKGDIVAYVDSTPVIAELTGLIRGMLHEGIKVKAKVKLGDIEPREGIDYNTISDKARAIGGAVLEAICSYLWNRDRAAVKERAN
jgi:xanthine dehydrogenase accessory factor